MIDINKLSDQVKKMIDLENKLNETDWKEVVIPLLLQYMDVAHEVYKQIRFNK